MTDKAKLEEIKKLADAMYYAALTLTTDASLLRKAMNEYHQFVIHKYCKEEPVSEVWHYQKKEPVNEIADKSRPIIVVYGNNSLNAAGKFRYYEDNSDAIWLSNSYEKWAFVEDLINLTHSATKVSWQKEPVSEELWEAAQIYYEELQKEKFEGSDVIDAFKAGAKWQKEQFEKDYTDLCNGIATAKGVAVAMAYNKGMADAREQMMAKAVEAVVSQVPCSNEIILYNPSSIYKYSLPQEMNKLGLNKGDKVKLVIIKED